MLALQKAHPGLAKVESITQAVSAPKTKNGNEIFTIKLSKNVATDEA